MGKFEFYFPSRKRVLKAGVNQVDIARSMEVFDKLRNERDAAQLRLKRAQNREASLDNARYDAIKALNRQSLNPAEIERLKSDVKVADAAYVAFKQSGQVQAAQEEFDRLQKALLMGVEGWLNQNMV